jgi:hypothetical protein
MSRIRVSVALVRDNAGLSPKLQGGCVESVQSFCRIRRPSCDIAYLNDVVLISSERL